MAIGNPAFSKNPAFGNDPRAAASLHTGGSLAQAGAQNMTAQQLQELYSQPSAQQGLPGQGEVMTVENTIAKTIGCFAVLVTFAAIAYVLQPAIPALLWIGVIVGLVLGLVNSFKKEPSVPLIFGYAVFEGIFVGALSRLFEDLWPGVVVQATLATFAVVGVTLALFASGKIRASKKATKIFMIAGLGYVVFSLLNFGMMVFGAFGPEAGMFGMRSQPSPLFGIPWGILIGVLAVLMAAYSLVLDFDFIQKGVKNRAPAKYGWTGAFGIMVSVVWLYVELLRIFAIARD